MIDEFHSRLVSLLQELEESDNIKSTMKTILIKTSLVNFNLNRQNYNFFFNTLIDLIEMCNNTFQVDFEKAKG
jgi:hypothetical protein